MLRKIAGVLQAQHAGSHFSGDLQVGISCLLYGRHYCLSCRLPDNPGYEHAVLPFVVLRKVIVEAGVSRGIAPLSRS